MSPVFLGMLGGTFIDPVTLVFVFGGLLLLCFELERPTSTVILPVLAGCLFGIATALKLTNVMYAASVGLAILVASRFRASGWRVGAWYAFGAAFGAVVTGGWWSFQLYREFGNPFFPLFNDYFHSPDFPQVRLLHTRFKPASLVDALTFPFDMASSHKWVYVENAAADIRFALLSVFALMLVAIGILHKGHPESPETRVRSVPTALIICFFLISFLFWMATSGNGRYGLPVLLLVGPVLILTIRTAIRNRTWFVRVVFAILLMQGIVVSLGDSPRWEVGSWSAKWIDVDVPAQLKDNAYGYLSEGTNSNSFIALNIHPDSRLVSLLGVHPLSRDGPGGQRVSAFISAHAGKLRMLGKLEVPIEGAFTGKSEFSDYMKEIDGRYAMWDLRMDPEDCVTIKYSVNPVNFSALFSCALIPGNPRRAGMIAEWERTSGVFDRIEHFCPALFNPAGGYTTRRGKAWYRHYLNTEARLRALNGHVLLSHDPLGPFGVDMGTLEDWEAGVSKWECAIPPQHWKVPAIQ